MHWSCATVRFGEDEIPLIGLPKSATEERCERCVVSFHLMDIVLSPDGVPLCRPCYIRRHGGKTSEISVVPGADAVHNVGR